MLGDRIRMSRHALDSGVFIRSLADRGHGGGLPGVSAEVVAVLDAAGFDVVLVETVGVGQSELDVVSLSDHVLLVCHPESGDGMQAMKSGILELADTVVVNKADLDGAWRTSQELKRAARVRGREVEVMLTIAQAGTHVAELGSHVMGLVQGLAASGELEARRRRQLTGEVRRRASALRARHITQVDLPPTLVERLHARQVTPALAALELLALIEGAAAS